MSTKAADPGYAAVAEQHIIATQEHGHAVADSHTIQPPITGVNNNNNNKNIDALSIMTDDQGRPLPTDEELESLRRVPASMPLAAFLIGLIELAERLSYYGATQVFQNFVQRPLPDCSRTGASVCAGPNASSGALGYGQRAATAVSNTNNFWVYVMPILGAYIADTHWGRFKTVCWAVFIAIVGHVLLVISALPTVIEDRAGAMACFSIAFIVMGVGTGWFKSNISPLIAEQIVTRKMYVMTTGAGERVIVDPNLTVVRVYMYFVAMPFAEKHVGYWLAYLIPTVVFALCPFILVGGRKLYRSVPPQGSVLAEAMRLWWFCAKPRFSWNPIRAWTQLTADDFWTSGLPSRQARKPAWMTFNDAWVYEVRRGFKANQINNNLVSQSATMTLNGVPNEIISNLDPLAIIIIVPLMDLFFYPFLRKLGINFTPLKRVTTGFIVVSLAMVWAAVLQHYIYMTNPCGKYVAECKDAQGDALVSSLNVWIQSGAYVLIALGEVFAVITGYEYAFTKAPTNMRSLVASAFLFMNAISSAIGQAFTPLTADPNLVILYSIFGGLAFASGVLFWVLFRDLDAQEDALNQLDVGDLHAEQQPELELESSQPTHHQEKDNTSASSVPIKPSQI
ncbi:hypothetical protein OC861_004630 [Tilletia horrida]|nr:hypothetical protein OC861_004630 [Tilletia horrida]